MTVTIPFFSSAREIYVESFFPFTHKDSAHRGYIRYISAISEGPLRVTAGLMIKMIVSHVSTS